MNLRVYEWLFKRVVTLNLKRQIRWTHKIAILQISWIICLIHKLGKFFCCSEAEVWWHMFLHKRMKHCQHESDLLSSTCQPTPSGPCVYTDSTMGTKSLAIPPIMSLTPAPVGVTQPGPCWHWPKPPWILAWIYKSTPTPQLYCSASFCSHNGTSHFGSNFQKGEAYKKIKAFIVSVLT